MPQVKLNKKRALRVRDRMVEIVGRAEIITAERADLSSSAFSNCDLSDARFENVDLSGSEMGNVDLAEIVVTNVDLSDARFDNVDLTNARFDNAAIDGLTINGIGIAELLAAHAAAKPARGRN